MSSKRRAGLDRWTASAEDAALTYAAGSTYTSTTTSTSCRAGSRRSAARSARSSTRPIPEVAETIKRTVQPYFVLDGNVSALLATKDHVNVFLYDGGIVPDPEEIITQRARQRDGRTIAIYEGDPINRPALTRYFQQIIANNRAGGWRRLKAAASNG